MLHLDPLTFILLAILMFAVLGIISLLLLRESKKPPKPDPETAGLPSKRSVYFALLDHYSLSDMENLCLSLGIDYSELSGDTKPLKARSLIDIMDEHDRYAELVQALEQDSPGIFQSRNRKV